MGKWEPHDEKRIEVARKRIVLEVEVARASREHLVSLLDEARERKAWHEMQMILSHIIEKGL